MEKIHIEQIQLIGLALPFKTRNANNQSAIDCGGLWQKFELEGCFSKVPDKLSNEIFAVYHDYDGDHTLPYAYFIGCKVKLGTPCPPDLSTLTIPAASYQIITAKGPMPDCVANAWHEIWASDMERSYVADFEIYDERSKDWSNAEVDIYIS